MTDQKPISEMSGQELYVWVKTACDHELTVLGNRVVCPACLIARMEQLRNTIPHIGTNESNVNAIALGQVKARATAFLRKYKSLIPELHAGASRSDIIHDAATHVERYLKDPTYVPVKDGEWRDRDE